MPRKRIRSSSLIVGLFFISAGTPWHASAEPSDNPSRAPAGGVQAPAGGVRAPAGGVRAPAGGVRGPGTPGVIRDEPRTVTITGAGSGVVINSGFGYYYPWYGWGWWGRWRGLRYGFLSIPDRYAGTVDGPPNQELEGGPAEPEPLTPIESARAWMYYDNAAEAAAWYRQYLEESPDDARVMREYAAALLEGGRMLDAVAMMGYAYSQDPGLVNEAMDPSIWGDSAFRLRTAVTDSVKYGHRAGSGNVWLLVAVLMQAEGRDMVALKMIDRAVAEGLDPDLADRMRLRLSQR
ncbi:MAG: hypothetical protein AAGA55_03510 [Planctomycetota bacterium]